MTPDRRLPALLATLMLVVASLIALPTAQAQRLESPAGPAAEARPPGAGLFRISTLDTGIFDISLSIVELRREPRVSVLQVRGFHSRGDAGSRWLLCMFNTLAILRGFEYWTALYPENADETVLIGFLKGPRDKMADIDPRFASRLAIGVVAPIERGVRLCKRVGD